MKKRIISAVLIAVVTLAVSSCSIINSILQQADELANLANCEYSLKNVSNLTIAGVNVKNVTNGNISATDVLKLSSALISKQVPLAMDVNIDIKNPTEKIANGNSAKNYTITQKATTTVPLGVNTDLYSMFSKDGINSLKNFVGSFKSDGTSSKVGLRIKPSLNVAGMQVPMPNYIKVEKKTGSNNNANTNTNSGSTFNPKGNF